MSGPQPSFSLSNDAPARTCADAGWRFDNSYLRLPEAFYARQNPTPVRAPRMALFNHALAESLGLNAEQLAKSEGLAWLAGNALPPGAEPIAQAYAGHQFGHCAMLGDGRAILLGEQLSPAGKRWDIQLKGAGPTAFSRRGDGRAALGPMLREYLVSEAMHALGIPTTRSLAVVSTGEPVYRETVLPGAVLTRVAASHIRVGTFEYAALGGQPEACRALADYLIERHYPALAETDNPYLALLDAVMDRQAGLLAQWQSVGFIHGVMNTDNMALSGETIDYGPCAFMDAYDPATVFSSIDRQGRYAYGNQPRIAQWNLARLVEALLPLLDENPENALILGNEALRAFSDQFHRRWLAAMRAKLGLSSERPEDEALIASLLDWMYRRQADYTNTFRGLCQPEGMQDVPDSDADFAAWRVQWQARLATEAQPWEAACTRMRAHNPAVIPRNHRVEEALATAVQGDFSPLHALLAVLSTPYADLPPRSDYHLPPPSGGPPYQTFCGT